MNGAAEMQTQQAKTVNFELTVDEANMVLAGLGELPAKMSMGLIEKIRTQAVNQLQAAQTAPVEGEVVN